MKSRFLLEHGYHPCVLTFGEKACGWTPGQSPHTSCDKTIGACENRKNVVRFGGFPTSDPGALAARAAERVAATLLRWRIEDGL